MKYYQCLDSDCERVTEEFRRIQIREGLFKCPFCRGRLIEISEKEYTEKEKYNGAEKRSQ